MHLTVIVVIWYDLPDLEHRLDEDIVAGLVEVGEALDVGALDVLAAGFAYGVVLHDHTRPLGRDSESTGGQGAADERLRHPAPPRAAQLACL